MLRLYPKQAAAEEEHLTPKQQAKGEKRKPSFIPLPVRQKPQKCSWNLGLQDLYFKELSTPQSFLSTLNWRRKYHVLALDTQRLNRWGFTQEVVSILCSIWQDSISHLREILQWNILTITMLLYCHFPTSPLLTFAAAFFSCLPRPQQDCSLCCWKAVPALHQPWAVPPIGDCPEGTLLEYLFENVQTTLLPLLKRILLFPLPGSLLLLLAAKILHHSL